MPHIWIKDIKENVRVEGDYLVKTKALSQTRQGNAFLNLALGDKTGTIEARIWERADELSPRFKEGDIVTITGQANTFRNQIQLQVYELKRSESSVDVSIFQEASPKNITQMLSELKKLFDGISNPHLKALVESFLADHEFLSRFKNAPAAKNFHHNYIGGLLEHTLSVCKLAKMIAKHYPELDADILLAAAMLHDIGKIDELKYEPDIRYSDQGRLLGHIVSGVMMLDQRVKNINGFPPDLALRLKHLILSHHGEFDFGSPKRPKFLEAFALHLIDDIDAKINGLGRLFERDTQEGAWTTFNNLFQRYFYKGESHADAENNGDKAEKRPTGQRYLFPLEK